MSTDGSNIARSLLRRNTSLKHAKMRRRRAVNRLQRDVLVEGNQRPVALDCECKQIEISDLVMSVDTSEIHGGIIA